MQLGYTATPDALAAIASIERTEDIRFSSDRRQLALTAITREQLFLFDIQVQADKRIHLSGVRILTSAHLQYPHGVDFLDEETLAVANRDGDLCLFRLPPPGTSELQLLQRFGADTLELQGPGSIAVAPLDAGRHELLVCRNIGHRVSRHVVAAASGYAMTEESLLLGKWLQVPDGIGLSPSRRWLAVSNHNTQSGLLYAHQPALDGEPEPLAVLRGSTFPHGIRIGENDGYVLMSDAGAPYVHVYLQPDGQWQGVYDPDLSLQVMDEALFLQGSAGNPQEGGPKGLDIDPSAGLLVTTCAAQPLAFFDLEQVLAAARSRAREHNDAALDLRLELEKQQRTAQSFIDGIHLARQAALAEQRAAHAEARLTEASTRSAYFEAHAQALLTSSSWRLTAPLRRLLSLRRRKRA